MKIGTFKSKVHCYAMCRSRTKNGVLANGATVDSATGKTCYCEFGMKSRNSVKKWTTTFITRGLLFITIGLLLSFYFPQLHLSYP